MDQNHENINLKYAVRVKSTSAIYKLCESPEDALKIIEQNEELDKKEGVFDPNYYEIYDIENHVTINKSN